jgi:hypothetical protein
MLQDVVQRFLVAIKSNLGGFIRSSYLLSAQG